jgi:PAS domain S-box-containing protein
VDIKLGFRLILLIGAALTALAIAGFAYSQRAFFADTSRGEQLDHVVTEGIELVQLTHEILLYGEPRAVQQWHRQVEEVTEAMRAVQLPPHSPIIPMVEALSFRFTALHPLLDRLTEVHENGNDAKVTAILRSQLFQESTQLQGSLREVKAAADAIVRHAYGAAKERQLAIFGLFGAAMILFVGLVFVRFHTVILTPLENLEATIERLRQGVPSRATVADDNEIGTICATFNQLLDQQEAARAELESLAERFRTVFEQAAVGMAMVAPDGTWLEVNQCLCDILGHDRDALLACGYSVFVPDPATRPDIEASRAILAGDASSRSWETAYRHQGGQTVTARVTIALARDSARRALYFVTVFEDITARKQAETALRDGNRRLEDQARVLQRANADLQSFAWVASHDLREPLRTISMYIDLIERRLGPDLDGDLREFMDYTIAGARRMYALIGGLLEYARIGAAEDGFAEIALATVVEAARLNLVRALLDVGATVTIDPSMPTVTGVASELTLVIQSLLENAIKFRDPARPPAITITCADAGADWQVAVADNGIGFEQAYAERIFGIFQRVVDPDDYEGVGVGLAVAKKIIDYHGGRIWAEARPGVGCTVRFTLPKSPPAH